ncbi:MAG: DUF1553 domain-containing protein [Armatimonadota bacterium]
MGSRWIYPAAALALTLAACGTLLAQDRVDYLRQVKPVLTERCVACHGVLKQQGGLRLDTAAFARKGGNSGPAVRPGSPAASPLIKRVMAPEHGGRMPPEGEPLKPEEIRSLKLWIEQNAAAPADEQPEQDPREHWSFRPVRKPPVPKPKTAKWARNPIDAFLAQRYEQQGLKPQPEAPRLVLIRRLYLDLIGLPPSPEELERAATDRDIGWYERLVNRLLADPRHGERWARQWMDIWRYSDWWGLGDQLRNSQAHIWHWRDWMVESLNADTPYDEMVRQMLAADELYPNDLDKLRATGFLARNFYLFNRHQWMEETVEHVSKGFLGLTVNCAKCHDHKYDPIRQADFYRLRAFFEPYHVRLDMVPGEPDLARDGIPRAFDGELETPTYLFIRGQESQPDKSAPMTPGVPSLLAFKPLAIQPVPLPVEAYQPERRPWVFEAHLGAARAKVEAARIAMRQGADSPSARARLGVAEAELARVEKAAAAMKAEWARAGAERSDPALDRAEQQAREAAVRAERELGASRARLGVALAEEKVAAAAADQQPEREKELAAAKTALNQALEKLSAKVGPQETYSRLPGAQWTPTRFKFSGSDDPAVPFVPQSSGRRTALADWITDRRNPLTARVAVNHLWTRHVGVPLVPTVFDFGRNGSEPTHPELLDWLAAEFMEKGWSMKHLHRLIVTSAAYRMSSSQRGAEANRAKDPDNRHFWRREPVRVEAEVVRDSLLALAGTLEGKRGGPPVPAGEQAASRRRSLYFFHSDIDRNLFLTTFDGAAVRECYRRDESIVPQQALALTNSALVLDTAGQIAERLSQGAAAADETAFIRRAFAAVLGSEASEAELAASRKALAAWRAQGPAGAERKHFVWALLNHNDFVTLR